MVTQKQRESGRLQEELQHTEEAMLPLEIQAGTGMPTKASAHSKSQRIGRSWNFIWTAEYRQPKVVM